MVTGQTARHRDSASPPPAGNLRRGDQVRIRSAQEIAATLDSEGDVDGLPFMPEMLNMVGRTFEVEARVNKTCDTINSVGCTRAMSDTYHLVGARCDGSAHGGCQAGCLLFFRESWLAPAAGDDVAVDPPEAPPKELADKLAEHTKVDPDTYRCQATQLLEASRPIHGYAHYLDDLRAGNASLGKLLKAMPYVLVNKYQRFSRRLPKAVQVRAGGAFPFVRGKLVKKTPSDRLDLQPGELVEVKSRDEILATLDANQKNRGLWFDREMLKSCGRRGRVLRRVDTIIDEKTGKMVHLKSDCIVLEGFVCDGLMDNLCPRSIYAYWREIWLRRVDEPTSRSSK